MCLLLFVGINWKYCIKLDEFQFSFMTALSDEFRAIRNNKSLEIAL